jgi:IclR family transcriptional regulator, blcABC operon repressor
VGVDGTSSVGVEDGHDPVPAINRAANVLSVIAGEGSRPLGPSELARRLGWPKSSLANICISLARAGLLRRVDNGYLLGPAIAVLGLSFLNGMDETTAFREACDSVLPEHAYTVQLAMLSEGIDVIYLACHNGTSPVRLMSAPGAKLAANSTATGKSMLASLPGDQVAGRLGAGPLPRLTPRTITSVPDLLAELELVRERGYALDDEETVEGVVCIARAVPQVDHGQRLAVSITLLKVQADPERLASLGARLETLTKRIGDALGAAPTRSGLT